MFIIGGNPIAAVGNGLVNSSGTASVDYAAQADMETGTSTVKVPNVNILKNYLGIAKVVGLVTQSAGTYTLQTPSLGITGINKTGTGVVQVNTSVTFSGTAAVMPLANVTDSAVRLASANITSATQITVNIVRVSTEVAADSNFVIVVFGDL